MTPVNVVTHLKELTIVIGNIALKGNLTIPEAAQGIVLFAHGSGSSRLSPRNRFVAERLNEAGLATLLFDLLTAEEETIDLQTRQLRFDIPLLAARLEAVTHWLKEQAPTKDLSFAYFGASTGAAAALIAAAECQDLVHAVVSRGGRPDLAMDRLHDVQAPTLLIVGGNDRQVINLNQQAFAKLGGIKSLELVPNAGHLFEEPGTLAEVATLASDWFVKHLPAPDSGGHDD